MAVLQCNMFSNCIGRIITFNAIISVGKNKMFDNIDNEVKPMPKIP